MYKIPRDYYFRENEMEKEKGGKIKGIKIRTINYAMIIAAAVLYVVLVYATVQASIKYKRLIEATEDYILCEKDAALVREGSDYLTEQVRLYVVTLEPEYMEAYFTEKNVTRRREQALEELEEYEGQDPDWLATHLAKCARERFRDRKEDDITVMVGIVAQNG